MRYKGTNGSDTLVGTADDDVFVPLRGHDIVTGGGGFDLLEADYSRSDEPRVGGSSVLIAADGTMHGALQGGGDNIVEYQEIEALDLRMTGGDDQLWVNAGSAPSPETLRVDGGTGTDLLIFYSHTGNQVSHFTVAEDGALTSTEGAFTGFERYFLYLGGGADTAQAGDANDVLYGEAGMDVLSGGAGDDFIDGGHGADTMTGGAGADIFRFWSRYAFPTTGMDVITDFHHGEGDILDLRRIDPDKVHHKDQAFTFIGDAPFTGAGGSAFELRAAAQGDGTFLVQSDMDHDGVADFAFLVAADQPLTAADFIL